MPTTNLSITSYTKNGAGDVDCIVYSTYPLYIANLILSPFTSLSGTIYPGTRDQGATRTIYLPDTHPVFVKNPPSSPFTLPVTYNTSGFAVTAVAPPNPIRNPGKLPDELKEIVEDMCPNQRIDFVTDVLHFVTSLNLDEFDSKEAPVKAPWPSGVGDEPCVEEEDEAAE